MTNIRENKVIFIKTIAVASNGASEMATKDLDIEDPENAREIIKLRGENLRHDGADICIRNL